MNAFCRCAPWALVFLLVFAPGALADGPPPINGGGVTGLDLQSQLEKGLKARRPVEFAYIAQIISLVEDGTLPASLVTSTYGWARKQPGGRRLQYFQFALQARVRGQGLTVNLPDLRNQAVGISNNGGQHGLANQ